MLELLTVTPEDSDPVTFEGRSVESTYFKVGKRGWFDQQPIGINHDGGRKAFPVDRPQDDRPTTTGLREVAGLYPGTRRHSSRVHQQVPRPMAAKADPAQQATWKKA